MTYVFDIDGTICTKTDGDYSQAEPILDRIQKVNELYDQGHRIVFLTARGMGRSRNSPSMANKMFFNFTKEQLEEWGVKHHDLFLGKPAGDLYIDDKGMKDEDFFTN
jgi:histidinol phosphatase-like enzyme